jgi:hypothetical protein
MISLTADYRTPARGGASLNMELIGLRGFPFSPRHAEQSAHVHLHLLFERVEDRVTKRTGGRQDAAVVHDDLHIRRGRGGGENGIGIGEVETQRHNPIAMGGHRASALFGSRTAALPH